METKEFLKSFDYDGIETTVKFAKTRSIRDRQKSDNSSYPLLYKNKDVIVQSPSKIKITKNLKGISCFEAMFNITSSIFDSDQTLFQVKYDCIDMLKEQLNCVKLLKIMVNYHGLKSINDLLLVSQELNEIQQMSYSKTSLILRDVKDNTFKSKPIQDTIEKDKAN